MPSPQSPLRCSVRTKSGRQLGTVVDVTIDPDSQTILQYHVKPSRLLPDAVWAPLLVHRNQVISIDRDTMVVEDATLAGEQPAASPSVST